MSRYTRNFSSRLGRYEKPRFGGSGVGDQFGSQFGDVASAKAKWEKAGAAAAKLGTCPGSFTIPAMVCKPWLGEAASAASREYNEAKKEEAAAGTETGFLTGILDFFKEAAPVGVELWKHQEAQKRKEEEEKRRAAERAAYESATGGRDRDRDRDRDRGPASKTGMYIGIGGAVLAVVVLLAVVLKK